MPNLMTDIMVCTDCGERKPRSQFSVADNHCLDCFYQRFTFCEDCGAILRRDRDYYPGLNYEYIVTQDGINRCYWCDYHCRSNYHDQWRPRPLDVTFATYDRIGSKVKFGVEIETDECSGYANLFDSTKFGAKTDCTIGGREFDSPVLYGDEGLDIIREFLAYGESHGWEAGTGCGCHTHYDMRDMSDDQLKSITYAYRKTQLYWTKLVPDRRSNGSYSHTSRLSTSRVRRACESNGTFNRVLSDLCPDRYDMMNISAYQSHKTFENRALEGTVDADTICNWITLNCRFIDAVKDMTLDGINELFGGTGSSMFAAFSKIANDKGLVAFMKARAWEHHRHEFSA